MSRPLPLIFALCALVQFAAAWIAWSDGEPYRSGLIAAVLTAVTAVIAARDKRLR